MTSASSITSVVAVAAFLSFPGMIGDATASTIPIDPIRTGIYDTWVHIPEQIVHSVLPSQQLTRGILRRTRWSDRQLSRVLEVTHPTIRALKEGRSRPDNYALFQRLIEVEAVVERVSILAGHDPTETKRILESAPSAGRPSAVTLLTARRTAESYLAALDVIHPPDHSTLMSGFWPARAGDATHELASDELA